MSRSRAPAAADHGLQRFVAACARPATANPGKRVPVGAVAESATRVVVDHEAADHEVT